MITHTGTVTNVVTRPLGSVVVSWTGNQLVVAEAADFPESGQFSWNGTVFNYTAVANGTPAPYDTLTTELTAPDGVQVDDPITLYPDALERIADVAFPEDSESVPCVVPHSLQPLILEGVRDENAMESVETEIVNGVWYIKNVVGQPTPYDADTIQALSDGLAAEQTARSAALSDLNSSLQAEIDSANKSITDAQAAVTAEQKARADADSALAQTITTRPVVTSSVKAPASPNTGDTWFVLDANGNTTGVQTWNGTSWVPQALTGSAILAGSITTGNLAANAITGDKIAAGVVTADKLLVGSTENLIRDGELVDPTLSHNWSSVPASCTRVVDALHGPVLRFTTGTTGPFAVSNQTFPVVLGDEIAYQFRAWQSGTHGANNSVGLAVYATKADGSHDYQIATLVATPTGGLTSGVLKVTNADWRTVQFRAYCNVGTAGTETYDIGQMVARRRSAGSLLVDGTVTATQLASGAVTTDKLSAGAVTADQLAAGAVTADKITAGAIGTDKLAANAITGDKISANAITGDKISAGAIDGMTINGANIYSPDGTSIPRVHLGGSVLEVIRNNGDNDFVSASLGGASSDSIQLFDTSGNPLAGFDPTGSGLAQSLTVNGDAQVAGNLDVDTIALGGNDLQTTLNAQPSGVVARQKLGSSAAGNGVKFGSTWLGYYELFYTCPYHPVRVTYDGLVNLSGPGTYSFWLVSTSNPDPTVVPTSPKADGSVGTVRSQVTIEAYAAGYYSLHIEGWIEGYQGSQRVMVSARAITSGTYGQFVSDDRTPSMFYAEDMGSYVGTSDGGYNRGGGTVYSGSTTPTETAPVATKRNYTSVWQAAWVKSWQNGGTRTDVLGQGVYGSYTWYSMIGFTGKGAVSGETGKAITTALSGATVSKVEVYLKNLSWYANAGGHPIIGHHGNNNAPSGPQTSGGGAWDAGLWGVGHAGWITVPSSWWPNFASGAYDGITLGEGASASNYGKFSNALADCQLRITYTR